jgi:hypothetical protein
MACAARGAGAMNYWKRFNCLVQDHRWTRVAYQPMASGTGYFLRCLRCGKVSYRDTPNVPPEFMGA